jgi:TonB family protein
MQGVNFIPASRFVLLCENVRRARSAHMKVFLIVLLLAPMCIAQLKHKIGVLEFESPKYPPIARSAAICGDVTFQFDLATDGKPRNIDLIASGHRMLNDVALKALQNFRFKCLNCGRGETPTHIFTFTFLFGEEQYYAATWYRYAFPVGMTIFTNAAIPTAHGVRVVKVRRPWLLRWLGQKTTVQAYAERVERPQPIRCNIELRE